MSFRDPTYLILPVPDSELTRAILDLRLKFEPWRASIPVEITVAGSSGVGPFANAQEVDEAYRVVEKIAASRGPIEVEFKGITNFTGTNITYLEPSDPQVFFDIQKRLVAEGLLFDGSPFPFTPHCTIAEAAAPELRGVRFKGQKFTLDHFAFYAYSSRVNRAVHRISFKG